MFKALDRVNYDTLQINKSKPPVEEEKNTGTTFDVKSLLHLACAAVNGSSDLDSAIQIVPIHLVPRLLGTALVEEQPGAILKIAANWPLEVLRFRDVLKSVGLQTCPGVNVDEQFETLSLIRLGMLYHRTKNCKLKCLDLEDVGLGEELIQQILMFWPLQSMTKSQVEPNSLTSLVYKIADERELDLQCESNIKQLEFIVNFIFKMIELTGVDTQIDQRVEVKLTEVHLLHQCLWFSSFMASQFLRGETPLFLTVRNIYIREDLSPRDMTNREPTFEGFFNLGNHSPETLKGLSMCFLVCDQFLKICKVIQTIPKLECLDLQNDGLYLRHGITRSTVNSRKQFLKTISSFKYLRRLDLGCNYLLGVLGEILDALEAPLEYLSLRRCDLNPLDLLFLVRSKHSAHIRELNLSNVCQYPISDKDRIYPINLLDIVKHFPKLTVLNLAQNHLKFQELSEFCEILSNSVLELKALDMSSCHLNFEPMADIVRACAKIKKMQWVRLGHNKDEEHILIREQDIKGRLQSLLSSLGRDDIDLSLFNEYIPVVT